MAIEPSDLILVAFFAGIGSELGKEFWSWVKVKFIKPAKDMVKNGGSANAV